MEQASWWLTELADWDEWQNISNVVGLTKIHHMSVICRSLEKQKWVSMSIFLRNAITEISQKITIRHFKKIKHVLNFAVELKIVLDRFVVFQYTTETFKFRP